MSGKTSIVFSVTTDAVLWRVSVFSLPFCAVLFPPQPIVRRSEEMAINTNVNFALWLIFVGCIVTLGHL